MNNLFHWDFYRKNLNKKGMSLAFVLLFVAILSFMVVPIVDMYSYSQLTAVKAKNVLIAETLATEMIEKIKSQKFSDITGMTSDEWEPVEGEWMQADNVTVNYPEDFAMFKRNLKVVNGDELPDKDSDLKKITVTVKWSEIAEGRSKVIERKLKLSTVINRKERWE